LKHSSRRDPLLVWKSAGILLDGHTRRELCIKYKKRVKVREVELADRAGAVAFILRIQRERRNLTREALRSFRGAEYNATKQRRGGHRSSEDMKSQSDPLPTTSQRLSKMYGVSEKTIKRDAAFARVLDRVVADYGDPHMRRRLLGAGAADARGGEVAAQDAGG
jgi:hypothetical protein